MDQYYFSLRPSLDLKYQRATAPIPTTRIAISMITPFQNQDDAKKYDQLDDQLNDVRSPEQTGKKRRLPA